MMTDSPIQEGTKPNFCPPKEQTSYHEAGHAVANVLLNRQVDSVTTQLTMTDEGESCGICYVSDKNGCPPSYEDRAITYLAARYAEAVVAVPFHAGVKKDAKDATREIVLYYQDRNELEKEFTDDELRDFPFVERKSLTEERWNVTARNNAKIGLKTRELEARAQNLIEANMKAVKAVAKALIASPTETLNGAEVHRIVEGLA